MNLWKPTKEECDLINRAAEREVGRTRIRLEPGIRFNVEDDNVEASMNIACVTKRTDDSWEDTDLLHLDEWCTFKKGVQLNDKGVAIVDFYIYSREGLESNVVAYYENGKLCSIVGTTKNCLLD